MKKYLIFVLILAVALVAGCAENETDYQEGNVESDSEQGTENVVAEEVQPLLIINDHSLGKEEYGGYMVTGSAAATKDLSYAEVKVKYYDKDGALVSSDYTNIVDLAANEPWKFKVYGPSEDVRVVDYKIAVGDCSEA